MDPSFRNAAHEPHPQLNVEPAPRGAGSVVPITEEFESLAPDRALRSALFLLTDKNSVRLSQIREDFATGSIQSGLPPLGSERMLVKVTNVHAQSHAKLAQVTGANYTASLGLSLC